MRFGLALMLLGCAGACLCAPPIPAPDGGAAGGSSSGGAGGGFCAGHCRAPPTCPPGTRLGNSRLCGEGCEPAGCQCLDCLCWDCVDAGTGGGGGGSGGGSVVDGGCPGGVTVLCPQPGCDYGNRCADRKRCDVNLCLPLCCSGPFCGGIDCVCGRCFDAGTDDEGSPCATSQTCSGDGVCRPDAGFCELACLGTAHCAPGQACIDNVCRPSPRFGVCHYSGGLNHMQIGRVDGVTGLCVAIHLSEPSAGQLGISAPGGWGVVNAWAAFTDGGCPGSGIGGSGIPATSGTGHIDFDGGAIVPAAVAVHATLTFPADAGVPRTVALNASGVSVCR